jgi:hypothetical protein
VIAADYPFLDVVWTMLIFFAWVIWFWLLITIFADVFRRHDISGWAKALWTIFVIFLPFLGVLIYLISQNDGMTQRNQEQQQAARSDAADFVRSVSSDVDPASQIAQGKQLLDQGAITADEYDAIKKKALAT